MTRSWELDTSPRHGSRVGFHSVRKPEDLAPAIACGAKNDRELLIEKFVSGQELTINTPGEYALPILEIISEGGFYNFAHKYPFPHRQVDDGAEHVRPLRMNGNKNAGIQDSVLQASLPSEVAGIEYANLCARIKTATHTPEQEARR